MGAIKNINTFFGTIKDQNKRLPEHLKFSMHQRDYFEQLFGEMQAKERHCPQMRRDEPRSGNGALGTRLYDGF